MSRKATTVDQVLDFVRKNRLATQFQVSEGLGISSTTANLLLRKARRDGLVRIQGKDEYQRFRFVAMIEWPSGAAGWAQTFANRVAGIRR